MRRLAALLAAVIVTAACTNEIDQSTRPTSVVGSYQLKAYGGRIPPVQITTEAAGTMEVLSGELVIGADKSWTESRVYRYTENGVTQQMAFGSAGSWTFLRDSASMQFNDKQFGYQFSGVAAGGSVTLSLNDGYTAIYSR
jgi:hypothetical protein